MKKLIVKKNFVDYIVQLMFFLNPTLQDNYPTVNLEASACGTPVITENSAYMFNWRIH